LIGGIEASGLGFTKRLIAFEDRSFARYYAGFRYQIKRCEWIYMSLDTLEMVESLAGKKISWDSMTRYANRHSLPQLNILGNIREIHKIFR